MAIAATSIGEVAATGSDGVAGSDTNAGFFNPGNANFPTDLTTDANTGNTTAPVVSSATYNFQAGDVGHWVFIQSSGSWTLPNVTFAGAAVTPTGLWAKIASVASNKATLNGTIGTVICYGTGGPFAVTTTVGVSTQATPTTGKFGVDYSQGGGSVCQITDAVTAGTTTITSVSNKFHKAMVGNLCYVTGGTGSIVTAVYEIVSDTGVGTIVVDRSTGLTTGTGATLNVGGCLASPGMAGGWIVGGNHLFIKNATYAIASASNNVTTGCLSLPTSASVASYTSAWGYNALRTDAPKGSSRPLLQAGTISTFALVKLNGTSLAAYLILDCVSKTTSSGVNDANGQALSLWVTAKNCTNSAFSGASHFCDATGCATVAAFSLCAACSYCVAWSNTIGGFSCSGTYAFCLSVNNSGAASDGFQGASTITICVNCTAYGNGRDGFRVTANTSRSQSFVNCISYGNAGAGLNTNAATDICIFSNCASGNNSPNFGTNITKDALIGCITLTADPTTNAAGGDYSLNTTAGGGALCRAGASVAFPGVSTTGYQDLGAVQHADPAGGGPVMTNFRGGFCNG